MRNPLSPYARLTIALTVLVLVVGSLSLVVSGGSGFGGDLLCDGVPYSPEYEGCCEELYIYTLGEETCACEAAP